MRGFEPAHRMASRILYVDAPSKTLKQALSREQNVCCKHVLRHTPRLSSYRFLVSKKMTTPQSRCGEFQ